MSTTAIGDARPGGLDGATYRCPMPMLLWLVVLAVVEVALVLAAGPLPIGVAVCAAQAPCVTARNG